MKQIFSISGHAATFGIAPPLVFLTSLAVAQTTSTAPIDDSSQDIIIGAAVNPAVCNLTNATMVSFHDALRVERFAENKCIAVDVSWSGRALFRTALDANSSQSNFNRKLQHGRLGLYGNERLLASAPKHAKRYIFVGNLRRCETAWPKALIVMGYCHYTPGPFLIASEYHLSTK